MAVSQNDFDILERKSAIYILAAIYENPNSSKSEIINLERCQLRTKFVRIEEMIDAGLVEANKDVNSPAIRVRLTPKGESIVKGIYENLDLLKEASARLREDFSSNQYTDIQGNVKPM